MHGCACAHPSLGSFAADRISNRAEPLPSEPVTPLTISFPLAEFGNGWSVKQSSSEVGRGPHCTTMTWLRPSGVVGVKPDQLTRTAWSASPVAGVTTSVRGAAPTAEPATNTNEHELSITSTSATSAIGVRPHLDARNDDRRITQRLLRP